MARILITSGPTRQYLDPVRYLTNASSGRMGQALANGGLHLGHDVVIVSGPVHVAYPREARVVQVVSTDEMLDACQREFPSCDGAIGAAAPCDYQPRQVATRKMTKSGRSLSLELIETPDIMATLGAVRTPRQWLVGFALETNDQHLRAMAKLEKKNCDLIVLNGPQAMNAKTSRAEVLDPSGRIVATLEGSKQLVADGILAVIQRQLILPVG